MITKNPTKLDTLIPFLLESLSTLICANDVMLFIKNAQNFITFDVEDQQLVQKTLKKLDENAVMFDPVNDAWAKDNPYVAYPIYDAY